MNPNALILLPARARQVLYVLYGLVALAASATQVGYNSLNLDNPPWLVVATAVIGFLAVPIGAIAALNVQAPKPAADQRAERARHLAEEVEWEKVIPNVPGDAEGD